MEDFLEFLMIAGIVSLGVVAVILGLIGIGNQLCFPGDLARIESVRADVQRVSGTEAEDIMGQAAEWNQHIASNKAYNRMWFVCLLTPNAWDTVQPIEIPKRNR